MYCNCRYNLMVKCFNAPAGSYFGPEWQLVVDIITRYLAVINSSINFIIYCVAGKQFRRVLAILLHLRSGQSVHNLAAVKIPGQIQNCTVFIPGLVCRHTGNRLLARLSVGDWRGLI